MSEFNLKAVLRQTGLTAETLRAWERRYGVVRPARSPTGRRMYSTVEVHRLRLLSQLVQRGFRIGDLAKLKDLELTKRLESSRMPEATDSVSRVQARGVSELLQALDVFDLDKLKVLITQVRFQLSPKEFALELVPALMYRVGALIGENRFSIAQEHALSQLVQSELRNIYDSLTPLDAQGNPKRLILFCTREGDHHEISLILAAILCRFRGMQCQYLGANFPADSVMNATQALRPTAVVLALSYIPPEQEKVSPKDFIRTLDQKLKSGTELWLGGTGATHLKIKSRARPVYVFESLYDLEKKLESFAP